MKAILKCIVEQLLTGRSVLYSIQQKLNKWIVSFLLLCSVAVTSLAQSTSQVFGRCITELKKREGFRSKPYKNSGYLFIGYGQLYKKGESRHISEGQASKMLMSKFKTKIEYAAALIPNLAYDQLCAISLLMYNIGSDRFKKSDLRQLILDRAPLDAIREEWMKYTKTRSKDAGVQNRLKSHREFEFGLFAGSYSDPSVQLSVVAE